MALQPIKINQVACKEDKVVLKKSHYVNLSFFLFFLALKFVSLHWFFT